MSRKHLIHALGSYHDREEFQVGRVVVWVLIPTGDCREEWLEQGDRLFELVSHELAAVMSAAERESRILHPEFWRARDDSESPSEALAIFGIWLYPDTGAADFDIEMPEMPDNLPIIVTRERSGSVLIQRSS